MPEAVAWEGVRTCYTARMNASTTPEPVRAWLAKVPSQHAPVVAAVRALVFSVAPDAREFVYHDALNYGPIDSGFDPILYVSVFRAHVNLGFFYGGFTPDPDGLLIGSGKRMRHVRLTTPEDCANPALRPLLAEAWAVGSQRVAERRGK